MPHTFLGRAFIIAVLCVALSTPVRAESLQAAADQIIIGIVVVTAAAAVLVTLLVIHHKNKNRAITGCVSSGATGMSVIDEKDKRTYSLAGDPVGVKAGDRMTLEGKRSKEGGKTLIFEARSVTKDFGVCLP